MQALQLVQPRRFRMCEVPVPELSGSHCVLIRQRYALVCGSDVPHFSGSYRSARYPFPVGKPIHECIGEVVESSSAHLSPGDQVLAIPRDYRGLAEYFVASADQTIHLGVELQHCEASTLIQPLATVMYGIDRLPNVEGETVAVIGLGPIGLMFCWLLGRSGAHEVIGVDPSSWRCNMASEFGAHHVFSMPSIELVHRVRQGMSGWDGPTMCIEAVGHQTDTINDCFELVQRRGVVLAFGVPDDLVYPLEFELFFRKNLQLVAAVAPPWGDYLISARDLFAQHRSELERLVTHRLPMSEAEAAYSLAEQLPEGVGKVVLDASVW